MWSWRVWSIAVVAAWPAYESRSLIVDDLLGSGVSNASGDVEIAFRSQMFREFIFDRRPEVYAKVYRDGVELAISAGARPRHVAANRIDLRIIIEEGEPARDAEPRAAITDADRGERTALERRGPASVGRVVDHDGTGVRFLCVEAWEKDLILDDLLGTDFTDPEGDFVIEVDERSHREVLFDRQPDLFFKVFDGDELVASAENDVLWNVGTASYRLPHRQRRKPSGPRELPPSPSRSPGN